MSVPTVAVIGAGGHGLWHRRRIAARVESGRVRLAGLCDLAPLTSEPDAPIPEGTPVFTDHRELLAETRPDIVVVCTPPHTHLPIAADAVAAGADLLLEKPPVTSLDEHRRLTALLDESGRACQVNFQALGSPALPLLRAAIGDGDLGEVRSITVTGSWRRPDEYYRRSDWAGKSTMDGRRSLDGALANPFAHAVMQALAVAGAGIPSGIEVERFRARDIEVDDTACLRLTFHDGPAILVAVTLCGEAAKIEGDLTVAGSAGKALFEYPTDRLRLPGGETETVPGRVDLLDDLIAHREQGSPLLAPLSATEPFTAVIEAVAAAPVTQIPEGHLHREGPYLVVDGVNSVIEAAGARTALFSELPAPWAIR
ncbi:Gfo/Idh/MocA family oxidoreductase [Phytomonospora sp. NPDC050363]|uniref:Gfo/Idh/MocA family protein n=1 Tax=Phytomonospora sp. NPDC050363 TaxID=3155642 RepID=UPI0033FFD906